MHFFKILCSTLVSRIIANPIPQLSDDNTLLAMQDDLDQTDPVSQLLEENTPTYPISVNQESDCLTNTSMDDVREEDLDESPNILRRLTDACPARDSNVRPGSPLQSRPASASTNSDNSCVDPDYKEHVTCGGVRVTDIETGAVNVLNCEPGKFFSNNPNGLEY